MCKQWTRITSFLKTGALNVQLNNEIKIDETMETKNQFEPRINNTVRNCF